MIYKNLKQAISDKCGVREDELTKLKVFGLGNEGIFASKDKVYKITISSKEAKASRRLIGKNFKNVVKIHNVYDFYVKPHIFSIVSDKPWRGYIIEQEKLFRGKKDKHFSHFTLDFILGDFSRTYELLSIINGLQELDSIGIKHKDFHSLNIMRDKYDNLKIIDFSIVSLRRR